MLFLVFVSSHPNFTRHRNPNSISSMCWNPLIATEIVVAYEDNKNPVIQLWNLKSTDAPMREFVGHEQVILWTPIPDFVKHFKCMTRSPF